MTGYAETYRRSLEAARGILGRSRRGDRLGAALGPGPRQQQSAILPLVCRSAAQHVLERARPPCRGGTWRAGRADLGQPGHRLDRAFHVSRYARPDGACCRNAYRARRQARRPRADLHADDPGGGDRDARLRPDWCGAFGRVRRLRGARAGDPHRRRAAPRGSGRLVRHRGEPCYRVQAAARCGDRRGAVEAGGLRRAAAADVPRRSRAGARP